MTKEHITNEIMRVVRGDASISEGASVLSMSVIDFGRMMNAWEDVQDGWNKVYEIAVISELKNNKTDEEIIQRLGCSEAELERCKRRYGRTVWAIDEVRKGNKAPGCGAVIVGAYVSEFVRMLEQEKTDGGN